jgi:hypothetical protein
MAGLSKEGFHFIIPGDKLVTYAIIERGRSFREINTGSAWGCKVGFEYRLCRISKISLIRVETSFNIERYMRVVC